MTFDDSWAKNHVIYHDMTPSDSERDCLSISYALLNMLSMMIEEPLLVQWNHKGMGLEDTGHSKHPVQEKTTLWVHPLKNDNVGSAPILLFFSMMNP